MIDMQMVIIAIFFKAYLVVCNNLVPALYFWLFNNGNIKTMKTVLKIA